VNFPKGERKRTTPGSTTGDSTLRRASGVTSATRVTIPDSARTPGVTIPDSARTPGVTIPDSARTPGVTISIAFGTGRESNRLYVVSPRFPLRAPPLLSIAVFRRRQAAAAPQVQLGYTRRSLVIPGDRQNHRQVRPNHLTVARGCQHHGSKPSHSPRHGHQQPGRRPRELL